MSLAASGGLGGAGAGAGALSASAMAHGGPSAMTTHQTVNANANAGGGGGGGTAAPPPTGAGAALGADLIDKNHSLNWKALRSSANLPIVSIDLYGGDAGKEAQVAFFPPKDQDGEAGAVGIRVKAVGGVNTTFSCKKDNDSSHKALRRLLTKSKGYEAVFDDTLHTNTTTKQKGLEDSLLTVQTPYLLLGARQTKDLHPATSSKYNILPDSTHAIEEIPTTTDENGNNKTSTNGLSIRNGNLDGSTSAQKNDFDRVTLQLQLHSSKKPLSVLPEEATSIPIAQAKQAVAQSWHDTSMEKEEEDYLEYPTAIPLPAWACQDTVIESLMDACQGSSPVLYQRSVCALAGALMARTVKDASGRVNFEAPRAYALFQERMKAEMKKREAEMKRKIANSTKKSGVKDMSGESEQAQDSSSKNYMPMFVLAGLTDDGLELTAIQVGSPNSKFGDGHALLGDFTVVATVAYQHSDPVSILKKSVGEFSDVVDELYPELEEDGGIAGIITYGTITKQLKMKDTIEKALKSIEGDEVWNSNVTFLSTQEDAVAKGTAILGAITHMRLDGEVSEVDDAKARPCITVKNVAPCAIGIQYNFHGGKADKWTEPKIIFDYDRRVPTSPYNVEFTAAECVALRKDASLLNDVEKLYDDAQKWGTGKFNNEREEAALDLRVQVIQMVERNGKWRNVGDVFSPLTKKEDVSDDEQESSEEKDGEKEKVAFETANLELTLDSMGFISSNLTSDGQNITQALQAARSSTFWYWAKILFCIVFFGGFFAKSFIDERILERDTKKILAFYKSAAPGTINDGDEHNARFLAYKYRGKKDKLWRRLETKYGKPVLEVWEYTEEEEVDEVEEEDVEEDLDEEKTEF